MAFCAFDDSAALFDSTPVENMFITEYMLRAPGDFVKVYLYALMLCYHPSPRMSLSAMAKDLDMQEEDVERAFKYWARDGLVRQVGDNPVRFTLANLKQLTLTRAENPGDKLYNQKNVQLIQEAERILNRQLNVSEKNVILDWCDVLELPEEVVLMLLQIEMENSGGYVSLEVADKKALEWAHNGINTVEEVEKVIVIGRQREQELRRIFRRLGIRQNPSDDQKKMYSKWVEEWGFSYEDILEACKETAKGTPNMGYLNGILSRYYHSGWLTKRKEERQAENKERKFGGEILEKLGRVGMVPTEEDLKSIQKWHAMGASDDLIREAAISVHERGNTSFDDINRRIESWQQYGIRTIEDVENARAQVKVMNLVLYEIYKAAGMEKQPTLTDRKQLNHWYQDLNMSQEMVMQAAEYAKGRPEPMRSINVTLESWDSMGIHTPDAARQEHEGHVQSIARKTPTLPTAQKQDAMLRYTPEERRATYSAAVVNFDEEDDGQ